MFFFLAVEMECSIISFINTGDLPSNTEEEIPESVLRKIEI